MDTPWCSFSELKCLNWVNPKDSSKSPLGCFLELDLNYPDILHDLDNDYPLEGEKIQVTEKCCTNINYKL